MNDNIFLTNFGKDVKGYLNFNNYLKTQDLLEFKQHEDFNYMTEHLGDIQIKFGMLYFEEIKKLNLIDNDMINTLLYINDFTGNPKNIILITKLLNVLQIH